MNKDNHIYVLGLNLYHGATACLIKNDEVIGCVSEERFTRNKNQLGIPRESIRYLLKSNGLAIDDIAVVGLGGKWPTALMIAGHAEKSFNPTRAIINLVGLILFKAPFLTPIYEWSHRNIYQRLVFPKLRQKMDEELQAKTGLHNFLPFDHHDCHIASVLYGFIPDANKGKHAVLTHDAAGDGTCSSVTLIEEGKWKP